MIDHAFRMIACSLAFIIFLETPIQVHAQGYCPVDTLFRVDSQGNGNCVCPSGYVQSAMDLRTDGTYAECFRFETSAPNHCERLCNVGDAPETCNLDPACTNGSSGVCDTQALAQNFRWIHDNASSQTNLAVDQRRILRAISVSAVGKISEIREAYKEAQAHNGSASMLIDQCTDPQISLIAYDFAEKVVRLRSCGSPPPVASATCPDLRENLRWSLLDSADCAPYSRYFASRSLKGSEIDKVRAEWVRRSIQVAQGHNLSIALSADFISDDILLATVSQIYDAYGVKDLAQRQPDPSNPFVSQACPGVLLGETFR